MTELSPRESELVALGAALGSNCVPCIEYHIPQARKAGLTDPEIKAAIRQADRVRQVPARKVLETATNLLAPAADEPASAGPAGGCGCAGSGRKAAGGEPDDAGLVLNSMAAMMSRMMSSCAPLAAAGSGTQTTSANDQDTPTPGAVSRGC